MKAPCVLCGRLTKLDEEDARGLPVRHPECHEKFMGPIREKWEQQRIVDGGKMAFTEEQIDRACEENGWIRSGVFATPEEIQQAKDWFAETRSAPVAKVHGHWLHEDADARFKQRIDDLAKSHGLPELPSIDGELDHYGLIANGEFTTLMRET